MQIIRKINKRVLFAWVILYLLLMLCAQSVTLHVHSFEHDPIQSHHSIDDFSDHSHKGVAHLSADSSHEAHHNGDTSESSACPDCLTNQFSVNVKVLALLTLAFLLLLPLLCINTFLRVYVDASIAWRFYILPPLRAPPL